jgi:DNA-binding NarL/FixJ family response regulator
MAVVVVADDHPGVRKTVCAVLESHKKCEKCVEAADGSLDLDIFPIIHYTRSGM